MTKYIGPKTDGENVATQADKLSLSSETPDALTPDQTGAAGTATTAARSDHQHEILAGAAGTITGTNAEGSSTSFARADHDHAYGDASITGVKLGALVGCQCTRTTSQSIASDTWVSLTFTTETYDSDNFHDNSTNTDRLTAPRAGIYLVHGFATHAAQGTGVRGLQIAKTTAGGTTTELAQTWGPTDGTFGSRQNVTDIVELAVNDYVRLRAYQTSGNNQNCGPKSFTIQFLGTKP